ncbi:MAG: hypothetical protein R2824_34795 [Saprospiraceae bacterium]|nr:hypothetical protein [Lewinella sp.]
MISLFVDKQSDAATMQLYETLEQMDLPKDVNITINNLEGAKSNILREEGRVVDISLANCYSLEDVVRELILLMI